MIQIKVLGTGCSKCKQTEQIIRETLQNNNIEANIEKVEDIMEIMKYDVMSTPAVVVNGVVKIKGRVPSIQEILDAIK